MKNSEFVKLLKLHADKTSNIRAYDEKWYSGAFRIPNEIITQVGCLVSLLQAQINNSYFCKKDEYLLIYNFQPLHITNNSYLCSLNMVIKPISKIYEVNKSEGVPFQLVVNGANGEVMNNSRAMIEMDITTEENLLENNKDCAITYGNYHDYLPSLNNHSSQLSTFTNIAPNEKSDSLAKKLIALHSYFEKSTNLEESNIRNDLYDMDHFNKNLLLIFEEKDSKSFLPKEDNLLYQEELANSVLLRLSPFKVF